jgi:hypothetical protein
MKATETREIFVPPPPARRLIELEDARGDIDDAIAALEAGDVPTAVYWAHYAIQKAARAQEELVTLLVWQQGDEWRDGRIWS